MFGFPSYLSLSLAVSLAFVPLSQGCFSTASHEAESREFPRALEGVRTHIGRQARAGHRTSPARALGRARPALISALPQRGIVGFSCCQRN